jgi:hypothetical protein
MKDFNMKFTKASKGDGTKVTVNVSELYDFLCTASQFPLTTAQIMKYTQTAGNQIILELGGVPTLFKVNRAGKTLATKAFPFKRPTVGHARNYTCTGVQVITNATGVFVG